ncbi:potassium transporter KefA [Thermococcus sp. 2319x1]|uniref:potassium transporter KefA n=1 Tax=Thermococcus sp. 2319x1 TaxID=1674923 RepID=UPI0015828DEA|nr:potassium transporter KefA [Thermococcus sp. 2319x1]
MRKTIALLVFLIVGTSLVSAGRPYDEAAEATFEALKRGDYSILQPYLDDAMKVAFDEGKFRAFRDDLISKYGELRSYSFVKEGKISGFILGYYSFEFERANVTLRLVFREVNGEYLLSGIWIDGVNSKEAGIPLGVALFFPVLGGFLALFTFYVLGFRRVGVAEIILGIVLVAITLAIQPLIQNAPFLAAGIKSNSEVVAKGTIFVVFASIWLGFIAGFFQESLKYGFSKGKYLNEALFIGIGFGLGEAILVPALQAIQLATVGVTPNLTTALASMLERYLATLFHAGTTVVLAYSYKSGFGKKALLSLSTAHGIIDTSAAYYQFKPSTVVLAITYVLLLGVSLFLLRYGLPKVTEERGEDRIVW